MSELLSTNAVPTDSSAPASLVTGVPASLGLAQLAVTAEVGDLLEKEIAQIGSIKTMLQKQTKQLGDDIGELLRRRLAEDPSLSTLDQSKLAALAAWYSDHPSTAFDESDTSFKKFASQVAGHAKRLIVTPDLILQQMINDLVTCLIGQAGFAGQSPPKGEMGSFDQSLSRQLTEFDNPADTSKPSGEDLNNWSKLFEANWSKLNFNFAVMEELGGVLSQFLGDPNRKSA